jgi:hypothetical protein
MSRSTLDMKIKKGYLRNSGAQRGSAEETNARIEKTTPNVGTTAQLVAYYEKWKDLKYSRHTSGIIPPLAILMQFITDHIIVYPSASLREYCLRKDVEEGLKAAQLSRFRPYTLERLQRHVKIVLRQQPGSLGIDKRSIRKLLSNVYTECETMMTQPPSVLLSRAANMASSELLLSCYDTADSTRDTAILALAMVVQWDVEKLEKSKGENFRTTDGKQWYFDNFVSNKENWIALPPANTAAILMYILTQPDDGKNLFNGFSTDGPFALTGSEISEIIARRLALYVLQDKSKKMGSEEAADYMDATTQWMLNEQIPFYSASIVRKRQAALATKIQERRRQSLVSMPHPREIDAEEGLTFADPIVHNPTTTVSADSELQYWVEFLNSKPSGTVKQPQSPLRNSAIERIQQFKQTDGTPILSLIPVANTSAHAAGQLKTPDDGYFPEDWDSAVVRVALTYNCNVIKEDEGEPSDEEWSTVILGSLDSDDLNET